MLFPPGESGRAPTESVELRGFWLFHPPLNDRSDRNFRTLLGRLLDMDSRGGAVAGVRGFAEIQSIWGSAVGGSGEGEAAGVIGKAPGMDAESGRAKDEVDGCCCSGLGVAGDFGGGDGGCSCGEVLAGGEGGGAGISVPVVSDSEWFLIGGSWNL